MSLCFSSTTNWFINKNVPRPIKCSFLSCVHWTLLTRNTTPIPDIHANQHMNTNMKGLTVFLFSWQSWFWQTKKYYSPVERIHWSQSKFISGLKRHFCKFKHNMCVWSSQFSVFWIYLLPRGGLHFWGKPHNGFTW